MKILLEVLKEFNKVLKEKREYAKYEASLVNANLNAQALEYMMDRVNSGLNVELELKFKSGETLIIRQPKTEMKKAERFVDKFNKNYNE